MNRQTVINKFIEKAGPLDPKPQYHYVQGATKGWYGLTTKLTYVVMLWSKKHNLSVSTKRVGELLPQVHREVDGKSYDFDESDILNCARMLQNSPFKDITVIVPGDTTPIAFRRTGIDIAILLAPNVMEIPPPTLVIPSTKFRGNPWKGNRKEWTLKSNLPNSTYQLWECDISKTTPPYSPTSTVAMINGYPIAQLIKCWKCGNETTRTDWVNKKIRMNHPECVCSCNTYDDFCGCQRIMEMMRYDRIRRESTVRKHFIRSSWDN